MIQSAQIVLSMPVGDARELSAELADFLCWARGFRAALQDHDLERAPMGVEAIRRLNITLKSAIEKAEQ